MTTLTVASRNFSNAPKNANSPFIKDRLYAYTWNKWIIRSVCDTASGNTWKCVFRKLCCCAVPFHSYLTSVSTWNAFCRWDPNLTGRGSIMTEMIALLISKLISIESHSIVEREKMHHSQLILQNDQAHVTGTYVIRYKSTTAHILLFIPALIKNSRIELHRRQKYSHRARGTQNAFTTHKHTVGRTPLDEGSARRLNWYY